MRLLDSTFIVAILLATFSSFGYGQKTRDNLPAPIKQKGYVWSFSTREGERNQLTQNLTTEFEELLVQSNAITVLNRTKFASMLEQWNMEKSVQELSDLPDSAINTLKINHADLVVFGEVYTEKQSDLVRITIIFQNFDSEIIFKESQDSELSKVNNSIVYREIQLKKIVNKICKAITGKKNPKSGGLFNRTTYKRGFGIELFPYVYEGFEPGIGLTFQSRKRWGANIGVMTEQSTSIDVWGGVNYDFFNSVDEKWSLLLCSNIGIIDFMDFFAFVDVKLRYKILTASFGIGYNNNVGDIILPTSIGFHLPIE